MTTQVFEPVNLHPAKWYTSLGVKWYAGGTFQRDPKLGADIKATRLFRVRPGQFVYNRLFATEGSFAVVRPEDADAVASNEFPVFDVDQAQLLPSYLHLHFQQPAVWEEVNRQCTGTTKSRLRWKEERFGAYEMFVPPVHEQERIVDLIGAVDDAIEAAEQEADMAAHFYLEHATRLQSPDTEPQPLAGILAVAKAGGTPSRARPDLYGGPIPWVKSGEVAGGVVCVTEESITQEAIQSSSAWLVPVGAVLIAMYGATAAQVGRLGVPAATNQAVLALMADEAVTSNDYLYHLLRADSARLKSLATGAAQPNLSKGVILRQEYRLPTLPEQSELAAQSLAILNVEEAARRSAALLRALRSNLLSALLSGEHEIPESYDELMGVVA